MGAQALELHVVGISPTTAALCPPLPLAPWVIKGTKLCNQWGLVREISLYNETIVQLSERDRVVPIGFLNGEINPKRSTPRVRSQGPSRTFEASCDVNEGTKFVASGVWYWRSVSVMRP